MVQRLILRGCQGLVENRPSSAMRGKEHVNPSKTYVGPTIIGQRSVALRRQRAQSANPSYRADLSGSYIQRTALRHEYEPVSEVPPGSPVLMRTWNGGGMRLGDSLLADRDNEESAVDAVEMMSVTDVARGQSSAVVHVRGSSLRTGQQDDAAGRQADQETPASLSPQTVWIKTHGKKIPHAGINRRVSASTGWVDISPASRSKVWARARPRTANAMPSSGADSSEIRLCVGGNACTAEDAWKRTSDRHLTSYWKGSQGEGLSFRKRTPAERLRRPLA